MENSSIYTQKLKLSRLLKLKQCFVFRLLLDLFQNKFNYCYFLTQIVFRFPFWLLFKVFLRFGVKGKENVKNVKIPLLIVTNHISYFDTILIYLSLPLSRKFFPIRSVAWRLLLKVPVVNIVLIAGGTFFVKKGIGLETALKQPLETLRNNGVVHIFPEGKRIFDGKVGQCKRGAPYLAFHSSAQILPIGIKGVRKMSVLDFVMRKRQAVIQIGKPFCLAEKKGGNEKNLEHGAEIIRQELQNLI